jgi:predicted Zn-ribbon and HTH transcriptional regulator
MADSGEHLQTISKQIKEIGKELHLTNKSCKFDGFVWFIIPKLMINLKVTHNSKTKK